MQVYPIAAALTLLIALHGWRKGSLSPSGAVGALVAGYGTLANPLPTFATMLLLFYLTGSRATKVKADVKAKLEREAAVEDRKVGPSTRNHKAHAGGQRDAMQVLCNSFTGFGSAVIFRLLYGGEASAQLLAALRLPIQPYAAWDSGKGFCALSPSAGEGWSRTLLLLALGHFACCMGDTLASELGILSRTKPVLVLNPFRQVPPGTNGGISPWGTFMSLLGGLFIGFVAAVTTYVSNPACSVGAHASIWAQLWSPDLAAAKHVSWLSVVLLGGIGGLLGSMIDSVLGATLQRTYYSRETKQVLLGRLPTNLSASQSSEWTVITGHDILTNNQVNLISSTATAVLVAYLGTTVLQR